MNRKHYLILSIFIFLSLCFDVHASRSHRNSGRSKNSSVEAMLLNSKAPEWMMEQIREDLAPFSNKGVKIEDIDKFANWVERQGNAEHHLARFKIINQKIHVHYLSNLQDGKDRVDHVTRAFKYLAQLIKLPDVDFFVSMHDSLDIAELPVPVFVFAKIPSPTSKTVLIPDFGALMGNQDLVMQANRGNTLYPWSSKIEKAVWRGAMTGGRFTPENFLQFPRTEAVSLVLVVP